MTQPVIPAWDDLTPADQARYAGNTDPWTGPVDPAAAAVSLAAFKARQNLYQAAREQDTCGCWSLDCAECGPRIAGGHRPGPGFLRLRALQHDAAIQDAREHHHQTTRTTH